MKSILITGGTGSFGSTVLKSLLSSDYEDIRIFSRDELKQDQLRKQFSDERVKFFVGDVRDKDALRIALKGVTHVFSAAALKQVPSCEFHPMEAVKTNVYGTYNTITAAAEMGVESLVVLSTDKAVYPINAMGTSKAMMEKVALAASRIEPSMRINVTRYGNVMGSRGSVIPFFLKKISENEELPVTSFDMTRFMMSLDEAVDLVNFALNSPGTGSVFVQKSPAATIKTLVEALCILFGKKVVTREIGMRHGEKVHEVLVSKEEGCRVFEHDKFYEVLPDNRDANYLHPDVLGAEMDGSMVTMSEEYSSCNTEQLSAEKLADMLGELAFVREYFA